MQFSRPRVRRSCRAPSRSIRSWPRSGSARTPCPRPAITRTGMSAARMSCRRSCPAVHDQAGFGSPPSVQFSPTTWRRSCRAPSPAPGRSPLAQRGSLPSAPPRSAPKPGRAADFTSHPPLLIIFCSAGTIAETGQGVEFLPETPEPFALGRASRSRAGSRSEGPMSPCATNGRLGREPFLGAGWLAAGPLRPGGFFPKALSFATKQVLPLVPLR